jgi:Domain of unknown function (DUF4823)
MRLLAAVTTVLFMSGCVDTHQLVRSDDSAHRLTSADTVFVAVPADGAYGADVYRGSGQNTAHIIYSAFARHTHAVRIGNSTQSFDEALAATRQVGQKYLVYPTILHWEDRATEWSGIPDKVEVKIEIVDAATGGMITSAVVKGKSKWATFGGDHPQDLLPKPVEDFLLSIY